MWNREARLLMALSHTNVPVAAVYGVCSDETVIGTQFFVMEMVDGRIFWDATVSAGQPRAAARLFSGDE